MDGIEPQHRSKDIEFSESCTASAAMYAVKNAALGMSLLCCRG